MLKDEMCWVIKNQDGLFVNPKFRALFSGITSGFTGYVDENILKEDLEMLGEGYHCEYINYNEIPMGERVYT